MLSVTLRLLSLVALCAAQTSSVSIWVPQPTLPVEPKDLVASIVRSSAGATTYVLNCASKLQKAINSNNIKPNLSGADANPTVPDLTCGGFPAPYTIVQGPSTIMWTYNTSRTTFLEDNPSVTPHSGDCVLAGTTKAVCTITDGTQTLPETTYRSNEIAYTPFAVAAGAVAATSTPISASMTEHTKKEANSTLSHAGTDSGAGSTTRAPSAMSGSSRLQVFHTGSIPGISSVKTSASTGAPPKSTNMGVQRSSSRTDGVFGALVIALAGAIL